MEGFEDSGVALPARQARARQGARSTRSRSCARRSSATCATIHRVTFTSAEMADCRRPTSRREATPAATYVCRLEQPSVRALMAERRRAWRRCDACYYRARNRQGGQQNLELLQTSCSSCAARKRRAHSAGCRPAPT